MAAGKQNIVIERGVNKSLQVQITEMSGSIETPRDLTGCTAKAQIKKNYDTKIVSAEFDITNAPLTTDGSIALALTSTDTEKLEVGTYSYDIILIKSGLVEMRVLEGVASVIPIVTAQ